MGDHRTSQLEVVFVFDFLKISKTEIAFDSNDKMVECISPLRKNDLPNKRKYEPSERRPDVRNFVPNRN